MTSTRSAASRRLRPLTALALAGALALGACSGETESGPEGKPTKAAEAPSTSPLTGLPIEGEVPRHPVLAVKVDNSSSSAPQVGLGSADMVVEALVEGGITRLAVLYYSRVPKNVGPVRSMRASDIGILQPLGAALVASGGAPQTTSRVREAGIKTFTEGAPGYYRESGRSSPYNLFMKLTKLAQTLRAKEQPAPYLRFSADGNLPKGRAAPGLTVSFSPSSASTFAFRNGSYVNSDSYAGAGDRFSPRTVLVLRVPVQDAGYRDPSGSAVPETKFTGRGPAMIFHGGRVVDGTWVKNGLDSAVELRKGAKKLELPAGKVWIELVPVDDGKVTVKR